MKKISRENAAQYYRGVEKETINCPICTSDQHQALFDRDRYGMGIKTVGCTRCGMIFLNPRPVQRAMLEFYEKQYRNFYESIDRPNAEYISNGPFQARADFIVDKLQKHILTGSIQSMLDIGCSEGTLIKTIKDSYPSIKCYGVEPDSNFARYALETSGAESVVATNFQTFFDQNEQSYDLITLTHVLEHLLDPISDLTSIHRRLSEGGFLYVEVPNVMDPDVKGIANIHIGHVMSFYPATLKYALAKCGFKIVEFYESGLPEKNKAMGAVCRKDAPIETIKYDAAPIERYFESYLRRCCPPRKNRKRTT